jgi:hypothetical protein
MAGKPAETRRFVTARLLRASPALCGVRPSSDSLVGFIESRYEISGLQNATFFLIIGKPRFLNRKESGFLGQMASINPTLNWARQV